MTESATSKATLARRSAPDVPSRSPARAGPQNTTGSPTCTHSRNRRYARLGDQDQVAMYRCRRGCSARVVARRRCRRSAQRGAHPRRSARISTPYRDAQVDRYGSAGGCRSWPPPDSAGQRSAFFEGSSPGYLHRQSAAGVRFLAAIREGRLKTSARAAGPSRRSRCRGRGPPGHGAVARVSG